MDTGAPYFPETPKAFRDTLFASAATERLAILAGGVPQSLIHFLRRDLPPCDIPSLLRQLRYTLLEHQFQTWITRNEAQPVRDHKPSYARPKRPHPVAPPRPSPNPSERKSANADPKRTPGTNSATSGNVPDSSSPRRPSQDTTRHAAEKRPPLLRTLENAAGTTPAETAKAKTSPQNPPHTISYHRPKVSPLFILVHTDPFHNF